MELTECLTLLVPGMPIVHSKIEVSIEAESETVVLGSGFDAPITKAPIIAVIHDDSNNPLDIPYSFAFNGATYNVKINSTESFTNAKIYVLCIR